MMTLLPPAATDSSQRAASPTPSRRDCGFTLTELLIAISVTGVMMSAITFALLFMLTGTERAQESVDVARDVTLLQAWVPVDLASAVALDVDPTSDPSGGSLPGTNVVTIERSDVDAAAGVASIVSYRYVQNGDEWSLVRYEVDPTTGAVGAVVPVARRLAPPPADGSWTPGQFPSHAFDVSIRNPATLRATGTDIVLKFADDTSIVVGGAGLGPGETLSTDGGGGFADPTSPPNRCGGALTIVLDYSRSIGTNEYLVENAAKDLVTNLVGTPTALRIVAFDAEALAVAPRTWNGPAVDMLTMTLAARDQLHRDIETMLEDGVGTNWEAGLRMALTDWPRFDTIAPSPHMPNMVIFVTDGDPTRILDDTGGVRNGMGRDLAVSEAVAITARRGEWGVEMKGVYIYSEGETSVSADARDRMKQVVGSTEWVRSSSDPVGNAATASFFVGDTAELAEIFRQIFVADCGGTVTVQKRVVSGGVETTPRTGVWGYTSSAGTAYIDAARTPAVTFDVPVDGAQRWVAVIEDDVVGKQLSAVRCAVRGLDVTASRVRPLVDVDGSVVPNGREVLVTPNEALSCVFVSS